MVPGGDLRFLAGAASLLALGASLAGYRNFSIYVAKLSLAAVAVAGMLFLVRGVARELLNMAMECEQRAGRRGPPAAGAVTERRRSGKLDRPCPDRCPADRAWRRLLLPLSGIDWSELQGMFSAFMHGVTVGGVRLAPADMIAASLLFSLAVMVTRYVQRVLDVRVLQRLQIDLGVQNSIRTGVGYFGFIMAMLVAIGALGLDLSNLALVAGALSVGIGFGLQNVVSNFAAGLILLVERPIKVGDWVIVGDKEGVVKRISVRATELQTFQRASVIIPNSELVSKAVLNWTFKDKFGPGRYQDRRQVRLRPHAGTRNPAGLRQCPSSGREHPQRLRRLPGFQRQLDELRTPLLCPGRGFLSWPPPATCASRSSRRSRARGS